MRTGGVAFLVARIIAPLICPRFKCDRDLISPSKIDILQTETTSVLAGYFGLTECRRFVRTPAWAKWG